MSDISLINNETKLKVSSVLNRDTKSYGRQFLCDGKEETCWNSDQGEYQWIVVNFPKPVKVRKVEFKFQGGFCCAQAQLECLNDSTSSNSSQFRKLFEFYPKDVNSIQVFEVDNQEFEPSDCYRIRFEKLTDLFGRLIVYSFQLYGTVS